MIPLTSLAPSQLMPAEALESSPGGASDPTVPAEPFQARS